MSIHLVIKSPSQQVDDIKVECESDWTVEYLKDYLCGIYPTKPPKSQQKIIYGGRLLPDHLLLKEVITRDQDVHIMHLVCPQSTNSSIASPEVVKPKKEEETANVAAQPSLPNFFEDPIQSDGLRQRVFDPQQYVSNINSFYSQSQLPQANVMPVASMHNAYQLAIMQQSYAQFLAQCFAQGQPAYMVPNQHLVVNQPPGPNIPPTQPNLTQPAPNVRRLNENDEGDHFDLLDSVYIMTRALMLFAVLYFYSTPGRIILVLGLGVIFCLYHLGAQRRQAEQNVPATVVEERDRNPRAEDGSANSNAERQTDQPDDQSENNANGIEQAEESPATQRLNRPSKLETAFVFVKTLFTSLIPDQPIPVDVN